MTKLIVFSCVLIAVSVVVWRLWPKPIAEAVTPCSDAVDSAVLTALFPILERGYTSNYLDVWMSHNYDVSYWKPRLDQQAAEIQRIRKWSESLSDNCTRKAYKHWLDYYQGEIDSAWHELRTQDQKKEMDAYDARRKRDQEEEEKVTVEKPPMQGDERGKEK